MMEFLGSLLKNIITVYTVIGCGVFLICMLIVYIWRDDEYIKRQKPLSLLIFSLVIGALLGEWINLEAKMDVLGEKLKKAVKMQHDSRFVDGFVTTSLIICVGAMAIVGSIQDGLTGDSSMLIAKAFLDSPRRTVTFLKISS